MTRTLSATMLEALLAGRSDEALYTLVVISGGGLSTMRYVVHLRALGLNIHRCAAAKAVGRCLHC